MSNYLDDALIKVAKKNSKYLGDRDEVEITPSLYFEKIAFDMYRLSPEDDPYHSLWTISNVDGKNYLVRTQTPTVEIKTAGEWSATSDYDKKNVTLSYKNVPLIRFSSNEYGFSSEDISIFKKALIEKIESNSSFVKEIINDQPISKKEALTSTFPELKKFI